MGVLPSSRCASPSLWLRLAGSLSATVWPLLLLLAVAAGRDDDDDADADPTTIAGGRAEHAAGAVAALCVHSMSGVMAEGAALVGLLLRRRRRQRQRQRRSRHRDDMNARALPPQPMPLSLLAAGGLHWLATAALSSVAFSADALAVALASAAVSPHRQQRGG